MARFVCITLDDFPVWALQQSDEALRGREVLVHAGARIVAATLGVRKAGVQSGWSLEVLRLWCPRR